MCAGSAYSDPTMSGCMTSPMEDFAISVDCFTVLLQFSLTGSLWCLACFAGQVLREVLREGLPGFASNHALKSHSTPPKAHSTEALRAPA